MVGLGDYSRNGGFVRGDVTASWRQYTPPQYDRARQFLVDRLDDSESMGHGLWHSGLRVHAAEGHS